MKVISISIPEDVWEKLNQYTGDNISAKVSQILAEKFDVPYEQPKRGGRRLPNDLSEEEIARLKRHIEGALDFDTPDIPPLPPTPLRMPSIPVPVTTQQRARDGITTGAQHTTPLNQNTLDAEGYAWAEIFKANNRYTGKLLKAPPEDARQGCRYDYVGNMTLEEFEKACGRQATFEGME